LLNTHSWNRGGLVTLPAEQSRAGNHVLDDQGKEVPAQRLATGELVFLASEVPAFGSRLYRVAAGKQRGEAGSGCKKLVREVRILRGQSWIELVNTLDKISTREKEGIHFGFAFNVPGATTRMDIPWGSMMPESDQLPCGNRNWLAFQRWVDMSNDNYGVTWTSIEAPLIEFGDLTANIIGPGKNWLNSLPDTQTLFSWALNNHWHTNFPLEQGGLITFRYQILPHGPYNPGTANRFGLEQNRPLIAVPAINNPVEKPLVAVENAHIAVSTFKQSEDGKAVILRLRSNSEQLEKVKLV